MPAASARVSIEKTLASLHQKLTKLVQPESPFSNLSGTTGQARDVSWVKPVLVAEIEFSNWTDEGLLRHPSFQGLREDKPASKVIHDEPISLSEVKTMENGREAASRQPNRKRKRLPPGSSDRSVSRSFGCVNDEYRRSSPLSSRQSSLSRPRNNETRSGRVLQRRSPIGCCPTSSIVHWQSFAARPAAASPASFKNIRAKGRQSHLRQVNISEKGTAEYHLAIDDVAGLISLVQMGVLEIHVWGSRAGQLEKPDRLIFDLDPDPSVDWPQVVTAAREVRRLLEELGLTSFLKTTGGKGLHLVVPVQPRTEWDEAKAFCRAVADFMVRAAPDRFIATMSKAARKGKIFIDYLRNGRGATAVAPFSTRAKPGATVSAPIAWEELSPKLRSDHFTIENMPARLAKLKQDPWADMAKTRQSITAAMMKRLASR